MSRIVLQTSSAAQVFLQPFLRSHVAEFTRWLATFTHALPCLVLVVVRRRRRKQRRRCATQGRNYWKKPELSNCKPLSSAPGWLALSKRCAFSWNSAKRRYGAAAIFPWTCSPPRLPFHGKLQTASSPWFCQPFQFCSLSWQRKREREKHAEIIR